MKVLLVAMDSKYIHTNIAIRYLQKSCVVEGINIIIKEFTINQKEEYILDEIITTDSDLICFSCYIWNIEYINKIASILSQTNNHIKILYGGPEVSYNTGKILEEKQFIDYIIFGEGEVTFNEFLNEFIKVEKDFKSIKGLAFRNDKEVVENVKRDLINDLDIINYPYNENETFKDKIIYYESSRGCPFECSFCMSSIEKKVRYFSIDRVKQDLLLLLKTNANQIKFVDRTFNTDWRRSVEIMDFIVQNNINNMTIHLEITVDIIKEPFLKYISTLPVNMFQFEIGVQSLNEKTLVEINRHMNFENFYKNTVSIINYKNVHIHLDLIAGLPEDPYSSFKQSFDSIYKLGADKIQLGFLKLLKGTKIYRDRDKHGIRYRSYAPYEVICTNNISLKEILKLKNIEELVEKYYNEKYFEKSLNYIHKEVFSESFFSFYESFSDYWKHNNLYSTQHNRKKLYNILHDYMINIDKLSNEFICALKYDYISNNRNEELPEYLDKESEANYKIIKRLLAKDASFKQEYFPNASNEENIINYYRIASIDKEVVLFVYDDKENIFNRCKTYIINDLVEEKSNEIKR